MKAYKNNAFLMSDEARPIRILSEYLEPRQRLAALGINRAIILFGSARLRPQPVAGRDWYAEAAEFAARIARWTSEMHVPAKRFHLCTGGGPGIMEAVHAGGARVDRRLNLGLNISLPHEQHLNAYVDEQRAFEFHYFFMRKFWFVNVAEGVVAFPGGFGTLDELFEVLTLIQTGKARRMPIVLYGRAFWEGLIDFRRLADQGVISAGDLDLMVTVDSVDDAFTALTSALARQDRVAGQDDRPPGPAAMTG